MPRPGDTIHGYFLVENANGQLANADSTPTVTIRRNGTVQPDVITVTNPETGEYAFSFDVPSSWSAGDTIVAIADVIIAAVTYSAGVGEWTLESGTTITVPTTPNLPGTRNEWTFWPNLEAVTLRESATSGYTEHAITKAKRRAVTTREQAASGGVYLASDVVWLIPNELLPSGVEPKPADQIEDADGVQWTIIEIQPRGKFGNTWRLVTRNLILAADLRSEADVLRPSFAVDNAAQRAPVFAQVYADVPCRLQEVDHQIADVDGGSTDHREYMLYVGQRLVLRAGDVIEIASVRYDVTGAGSWDRIDRLGEVRLTRRGAI